MGMKTPEEIARHITGRDTPTGRAPFPLKELRESIASSILAERSRLAEVEDMERQASDHCVRLKERIAQLEAENQTFRNAQKACEDCDAPTMERIAELEKALEPFAAVANMFSAELPDA